MLRPFACCGLLFGVVKLLANNSQHFVCSAIAEAKCNNVESVFAVIPTLLGPRMRTTHGLHVSFPRCTAGPNIRQQCWELLHQFARHSVNTDTTTPNVVGPTMLGVVASVCAYSIEFYTLSICIYICWVWFEYPVGYIIILDLDPGQESSPPFLSSTFVKRPTLLTLAIALWRLPASFPGSSLLVSRNNRKEEAGSRREPW